MNRFAKQIFNISPQALFGLTASCTLGVALLIIGIFFFQVRAVYEHQLLDEVRRLAVLASDRVDPQLHKQLTSPEQTGNATYRKALKPLLEFHRKVPEIHYLYTMVTRNGIDYFVLDTAFDKGIRSSPDVIFSTVMEPFESPEKPVEERAALARGESFVYDEPYTDNFGTFINAVAPIFDENHERIGHIGVDFRISQYEDRLAQLNFRAGVTFLLAVFLSFGVAYVVCRLHQTLCLYIAQQQEHENHLRIARFAAESANLRKSEILEVVTHQMKTPIGAIDGYAELTRIIAGELEDQPRGQQITDLQQSIDEATANLQSLTRQLLSAEEIAEHGIELHNVRFLLNDLVSQAINRHKAQARRKTIEVHVIADVEIVASGDPDRLLEAMENLISNAIKFSPETSTVYIQLYSPDAGKTARFVVRDEGPGLSEADRQNLFQPFQRLSAKPTRGECSTGLGLSIVKRIIEAHNGRVWCEPTDGYGATFVVEIPTLDCLSESPGTHS